MEVDLGGSGRRGQLARDVWVVMVRCDFSRGPGNPQSPPANYCGPTPKEGMDGGRVEDRGHLVAGAQVLCDWAGSGPSRVGAGG